MLTATLAFAGCLWGAAAQPTPVAAEPEAPVGEVVEVPAAPDETEGAPADAAPPREGQRAPEEAPAGAVAKPPPTLEQALQAARRVGRSWDLQLEVGLPFYATFFDSTNFDSYLEELGEIYSFQDVRTPVLVRARLGFLVLDEPWYLSIGATVSYGGLGGAAVGAQADLTNVWGGVWGQAETAWSFTEGLMLSLGFGYNLLGAEIKVANGGRDVAFLAKMRIPIGLVFYVRGVHDAPKRRGEDDPPG